MALAGAALYSLTWTDAIQSADSGELVTVACRLGVAHPPGYPLYTLLGHALCGLPWSTPAGRLGGLSVAAGVLALLCVYGLIRRMTASRFAGAAAALVLGTGPIFWRQASQAEVFALHAALVGLLLLASYLAGHAASPRRHLLWSIAVGLAGGLALSNQHTVVMLAPVPLLAVLLPWRSTAQAVGRIGAALCGLLVGLLPYLHLLLADPSATPRWGRTETWSGLAHHFLRRDYGTFTLSANKDHSPLSAIGYYLASLPGQLGWPLFAAALLGLVLLGARATARRQGSIALPGMRRDLAGAIAVSPLLGGPLLMSLFNIPAAGHDVQIIQRFAIMPNLTFALALGVGLAWCEARWLDAGAAGRRGILWKSATFAGIALLALAGYGRADVSRSYVVEDYGINCLTAAEANALIIGTGDVQSGSITYAKEVLGRRPDVRYLHASLLFGPWYVEQQRRIFPGFSYVYRADNVDTVGLIRAEQRRGVPVYITAAYSAKVNKLPSFPVGPMRRILAPGERPLAPAEAAALNRALFGRFSKRGALPDPDEDPWSASLLASYADSLLSLARGLRDTGKKDESREFVELARSWAPWVVSE